MHLQHLDSYLGEGTYNIVYSVRYDPKLVVKVAKANNQQLLKQADILSTLDSTNLFPKLYYVGKMDLGTHPNTSVPVQTSIMVMEKLGISLDEFLTMRHGNISHNTIKNIGNQLLNKLKVLHSKNIVHNDIKPANILFGLKQKRSQVFFVDFGLSEEQGTMEYSHRNDRVFKGNIRFCSLRKLKGFRGQKLDDIQSMLYVLIWLLLGAKDVSQLVRHQQKCDQNNFDNSQMSLQEHFSRKIQQKTYFLQNAQKMLKNRVSEQKLHLIIKICAVLQTLSKQYCEERAQFFYSSISVLLQ